MIGFLIEVNIECGSIMGNGWLILLEMVGRDEICI